VKIKGNIVLLVLFILIFALLSITSSGRFLSFDNLQTMAFQIPELGIITF